MEKGMKKQPILFVIIAVTLFLASGCSQSVEDKLNKAEEYLESGKFNKAQKLIEQIVLADSTSPEAIYGQALINEYQGFEWEALFKLIEASPMRNGYLPAMEKFIEIAIKLDYLENARKMTGLYIKRLPESPQGYYYLMTIDLREDNLDSARANLALANSRTDDELQKMLAEAAVDFHSDDEIIIGRRLTDLSQTEFKTADQFRRLGELYHYLNMGDSAILYMRRAHDRDDRNIKIRYQLAEYLADEMKMVEAHALIKDIIADSEGYGAAWILITHILWDLNRELEGEQNFIQFRLIDKDSPIGLDKHGEFYSAHNEREMAAIEWQAAYTLAVNLKYPDDYLRHLYLNMVNGFLDDHDFGTALDYFQEGLQLLPESMEMVFIEAELKSYFPEVADSARMLVDDQVDQHWQNTEWLAFAGRYYFRRGKFDQGINIYSRLLELPSPRLDYYLRLLRMYKYNKDIPATDALAENLPLRFRGSVRIHEFLYEIYEENSRTDRAIRHAEILCEHSKEFMPYILNLSDLYLAKDRRDEARGLITGFLSDFPEDPESHYRLARFDFLQGDYDSVLYRIEKSLALDTAYAYSFELKGEYFQAIGRMDSALHYYEKAIGHQWPTPNAYHNLAAYLLEQYGDLDRAAGLAMAAVRYFSDDPRGYMLLGNIYMAQAKYKMARLQFHKGTRLFPDNPEYYFMLGKAYIKLEDNFEAYDALKNALDLNLPSPHKEEAEKLIAEM
jgi:tetratricopeptide (TPR) repeat protein